MFSLFSVLSFSVLSHTNEPPIREVNCILAFLKRLWKQEILEVQQTLIQIHLLLRKVSDGHRETFTLSKLAKGTPLHVVTVYVHCMFAIAFLQPCDFSLGLRAQGTYPTS